MKLDTTKLERKLGKKRSFKELILVSQKVCKRALNLTVWLESLERAKPIPQRALWELTKPASTMKKTSAVGGHDL